MRIRVTFRPVTRQAAVAGQERSTRARRAMRAGWGVLWLTGIGVGSAPAQGEPPRLAVVAVAPSAAPTGTNVLVHGRLPRDGRETTQQVTLRITGPSTATGAPPPVIARVPTDSSGRFGYTFTRTTVMGRYVVSATSPGGRFSADDTFHVTEIDDITEAYTAESLALMRQAMSLIGAIEGLLPRLPASPARTRLLADWQAAQPRLAAAREAPVRLRTAFAATRELFRHPDPPPGEMTLEFDDDITIEFDDETRGARSAKARALRRLRQWEAESRRQRAIIDGALAASRTAGERCEVIEQVTEGLQLASAIFTLASQPLGIVMGFAKEAVASAASGVVGSHAAAQAAAGQAVKQLEVLTNKDTNVRLAAHGVLVDLSSQVSRGLFNAYCDVLSGPFRATMAAEFFNLSGTWWRYRFAIRGRLFLRSAKTTPGTARIVRGEFMGSGENFLTGFRPPFDPKFIANTGSMVFSTVVPPLTGVPGVRPEFLGKVVEMQAPKAFFIPVRGQIVNGTVTLTLDPARKDFEGHTSAWAMYLLLSPLTLQIDYEQVELPFKGAHHLLTRVAHEGPVVFRVKTANGLEEGKESFSRTKVTAESRATYAMELRVCGGGCP